MQLGRYAGRQAGSQPIRQAAMQQGRLPGSQAAIPEDACRLPRSATCPPFLELLGIALL